MTARLRPRFCLEVDLDADAVMALFAARKQAGDLPYVLRLYEHQVELSVREADRHFWSPFLNLIVHTEDGRTTLRGKYGPNINVWTMFLGAYAALFIVGSVGVVAAWSQALIKQPVTGHWVALGCAALAAAIYALGRFGRHLAHPQMVGFHDFIETLFAGHILALRDEEAR